MWLLCGEWGLWLVRDWWWDWRWDLRLLAKMKPRLCGMTDAGPQKQSGPELSRGQFHYLSLPIDWESFMWVFGDPQG